MPQPDAFDPLDFLKLAQDLASVEGEDRLRTATGRAYYALFLLARERTGVYPTGPADSAHGAVIREIRKRKGFAVGNGLYQLKELRIAADYQLLPADPARQNWARNWARAAALVKRLLPHLQSL